MIKTLAKSIREYKKDSILSPLFVSLEVVMEVLIPLLMAKIVDVGIPGGDLSYIGVVGGIMLGCTVLSFVFGVFSGKFAASASAGFAKNLRKDMYYNIQNFSFSNIDRFSSASLVTRMTTDVTFVQYAYQMMVRMLFRAPVMLIAAMAMSFTINASLGLVFLATVPVLAAALFLIMAKSFPIYERVFTKYDKLNDAVQENLRGIRVVKSYVREDYETKKFKGKSEDINRDFLKGEKLVALCNPLMQFCMYLCILLISWFGAHIVVGGAMETGELMSLMVYVMQILSSLMMLSMVIVMATIARASAERIAEVLQEKSDLTSPENADKAIPDGSVEFDGVSFSYANDMEKLCLKDINLSVRSGETVGVLGGTGSAKSTFVQMIPRLYDVTDGSVRVGGKDVRSYDIEALRNEVAMVLQKNVLFSGTIRENLRWGNPDATDEELERACRLAQADGFIQSFPDKYDTYIEQGGTNVSGGQKQRLCIARALLKKPKILVLDDSTSAVDTKTDALIRQAFQEEIPNTTKFIIAQRVSSVMDADKIVVLDEGRIVACGTHEELLASSDIYREVFESQRGGVK